MKKFKMVLAVILIITCISAVSYGNQKIFGGCCCTSGCSDGNVCVGGSLCDYGQVGVCGSWDGYCEDTQGFCKSENPCYGI